MHTWCNAESNSIIQEGKKEPEHSGNVQVSYKSNVQNRKGMKQIQNLEMDLQASGQQC